MIAMTTRKFAAFDIDGTIFRWQLYHQLVFDLARHGALPASFEEQIAPYLENWRRRSDSQAFASYELKLVTEFAKHLKGLSVAAVSESAARVMAKSSSYVYTYTRDLLRSLKADGYVLIALSGSFTQVVEPFAKQYNFDYWVGTDCESQGGLFTGEVTWNYDRKADNLALLIPAQGLGLAGSIAVGDTASDIPMLGLVETPIAFNPNRELFDHATSKGWAIVVERKNVVYRLAHHDGGYVLGT